MNELSPNPGPELDRAALTGWFHDRLPLDSFFTLLRKKTVPIHAWSWVYVFGGAATFLLVLQFVTGCLLALYYQPTEAAAHASVQRIMTEVPFGWCVRSVHVWGANFFIAVVFLHFLVKLFTRAYRRPREITWLSGVLLLGVVLGLGFSGYLLPWNELSYYATLVGTQIPGTIPIIGEFLVQFARGGAQVTGDTITRFYALHMVILPAVLVGLLAIHILMIQIQGIGLPLGVTKDRVRDESPFFSEFLLTDASLALLLFGAILTLAVCAPAEIGIQADRLKPPPPGIKPEWYFLFLFEAFKLVPEAWGVAMTGLLGFGVLLLPFLDRRASCERKSPILTCVLVLVIAVCAILQIVAIVAPGVEHPPLKLEAPTYSFSRGLVSLAILWTIIGFLVYYLLQLQKANHAARKLGAPGQCSQTSSLTRK